MFFFLLLLKKEEEFLFIYICDCVTDFVTFFKYIFERINESTKRRRTLKDRLVWFWQNRINVIFVGIFRHVRWADAAHVSIRLRVSCQIILFSDIRERWLLLSRVFPSMAVNAVGQTANANGIVIFHIAKDLKWMLSQKNLKV